MLRHLNIHKAIFLASVALAVATGLMPPFTALAGWTPDPWNGMVTVTNESGTELGPQIIRTGSGYIVLWFHPFTMDDPGVQKYQVLDTFGNPLLEPTGREVLEGATWMYGGTDSRLLPDGEGGGIAVFRDWRAGKWDIYGQRFDQWGQPLWVEIGMPLAVWANPQDMNPKDCTSDGNGNFFIAWSVNIETGNVDQYAQKFDLAGQSLWGAYGVPASTALGTQGYPQAVGDGQGGLLEIWEDNRTGGSNYFLYAQHFNASGIPQLTYNGTPLYFPGTTNQIGCGGLEEGVPVDLGGVFVYTTGAYNNALKALRVNTQGRSVWSWDSGILAQHFVTQILQNPTDSTLWITANDNRSGSSASYLYHLDLNGNPLFNPQGITGGELMAPTNNGVITFKTILSPLKVVASRVTNAGASVWESIVALCESPSFNAISSTSDGFDGAVVTMLDGRAYPVDINNIAAQRVRANGEIGNPLPPRYFLPGGEVQGGRGIQSLPGNQIRLTLNKYGNVTLELYDILGRKAAMLLDSYKDAGTYSFTLDLPELSSGMYLLRSTTPDGVQIIKIPITR